MPFPPSIAALVAAAAAVIVLIGLANRRLSGRALAAARWAGAAILAALFFGGLRALGNHTLAVQITKAVIAVAAARAVVYEHERAGRRRPIAERWKRFVALSLALAALAAYWGGFTRGHPRGWSRWEHYHYYMGAKYFREIGYDNLYRCTVIAQDEIGAVRQGGVEIDMSAEVRRPDKKIRNIGGDNLLGPVTEVLAHPEACKQRFSADRWESYKADVRFFRLACDAKYWNDMQWDKGYNPPPVWTLGGWVFASMFPAGEAFSLPLAGEILWAQVLATLDLVYLAGTFAALWWAFGYRVAALAAIVLGTQGWAPISWTQGAFLRQDWLFWMILAACAARRRWFALSGAALVYASLLRVFPALTAMGWLVVAGAHLARRRTLSAPMWRTLGGGALAAALLIPASLVVAGPRSYQQFFDHTIKLHNETPATNRMGIRALFTQDPPIEIGPLGTGPESGRMKYAHERDREDPYGDWMDVRKRRWARFRHAAYAAGALCLLGFALVVRRIRSLWIAQCLSHLFIVLLAQLASYYYVSMLLLVPLTRARRRLEIPLLALAAVSQGTAAALRFGDDRHWMLSLLCLAFCLGTVGMFVRKSDLARLRRPPRPES